MTEPRPGEFPPAPPPSDRNDSRDVEGARAWLAKLKAELLAAHERGTEESPDRGTRSDVHD